MAPKQARLFEAATAGDLAAVKAAVKAGMAIDTVDHSEGTDHPYRALDYAVGGNHEAVAMWLLEQGAVPTNRTTSQICVGISEKLLDRLIAAGLDVNDSVPGSELAHWICYIESEPDERVILMRRLVARGFRFDAPTFVMMLNAFRREGDEALALIDYAIECGLDLNVRVPNLVEKTAIAAAFARLTLEAVEHLAAAGATINPSLKIKSTWPEAKAKRAWLAAQGTTTGNLRWKEFEGYADDQLTAETVVAQLVSADQLFPGHALGASRAQIVKTYDGADDLADHWESGSDPQSNAAATHDFDVSYDDDLVTCVEYRLRYLMTRGDGHVERGKATFAALAKQLARLHGKPTKKSARSHNWELDDRWIDLSLSSNQRDRPSATVTLVLRRPS